MFAEATCSRVEAPVPRRLGLKCRDAKHGLVRTCVDRSIRTHLLSLTLATRQPPSHPYQPPTGRSGLNLMLRLRDHQVLGWNEGIIDPIEIPALPSLIPEHTSSHTSGFLHLLDNHNQPLISWSHCMEAPSWLPPHVNQFPTLFCVFLLNVTDNPRISQTFVRSLCMKHT